MNPVLLKPETDTGAQVIVQGKRRGTQAAGSFMRDKTGLLEAALDSYHRLASQVDLVLIEGAGSPAETNLRQGDIANMGFACAVQAPVVLVGDIHRGGVIAQIVGTQAVLEQQDLDRIVGFIVNRFRGDISLFDAGRDDIARRTGWPALGVVPWFWEAWKLPAEDMMDIASRKGGACKIVVPQLERMANFDDLDPLAAEPEVTVEIIPAGKALPGDADLVLIPGSNPPSGILPTCARRAGTSTFWRITAGAAISWACVAAIKCLAKPLMIHMASKEPPARLPGLGFWMCIL